MSESNSNLRYVVLHHEGISDPHFDLMFERQTDSALITVRLSEWPPTCATKQTRLPDHRRAYLDYEGPISGDRGSVRRIASGPCIIENDRPGLFLVRLGASITLRIVCV